MNRDGEDGSPQRLGNGPKPRANLVRTKQRLHTWRKEETSLVDSRYGGTICAALYGKWDKVEMRMGATSSTQVALVGLCDRCVQLPAQHADASVTQQTAGDSRTYL